MGSDGVEDVTIATNSSPSKILGSQYSTLSMLPTFGGVMCAKASMLLQVNSSLLVIRLFQSLDIYEIFLSQVSRSCSVFIF